jgi:hypothetical protein
MTYEQAAETSGLISLKLERIAYRLRQGSISEERAAEQLREVALELETIWS